MRWKLKYLRTKQIITPAARSQHGTVQSTHLVEDGLVGTDEAPLEHFLLAVRILDGVADMEQLAVISHVGVVTVGPALTGELVHDVLPDGVGVGHQAQLGRYGVLGWTVVVLSLEYY